MTYHTNVTCQHESTNLQILHDISYAYFPHKMNKPILNAKYGQYTCFLRLLTNAFVMTLFLKEDARENVSLFKFAI